MIHLSLCSRMKSRCAVSVSRTPRSSLKSLPRRRKPRLRRLAQARKLLAAKHLQNKSQPRKNLSDWNNSALRRKRQIEFSKRNGTNLTRRPSSIGRMRISRRSLLSACRIWYSKQGLSSLMSNLQLLDPQVMSQLKLMKNVPDFKMRLLRFRSQL